MPQDWRLDVCTRWRPLATILLVCLSLVVASIVIFSVYNFVDEYPIRRFERRIHRVKVGMSIAEVENILGPPDSKADKVERENPDLDEGGSDKIVEYRYSARSWLDDSLWPFGSVFVDENTGRIASVHLSMGWGIIGDGILSEWAFLIALGLIISVTLIVLLLFRRWCQSVTDAAEYK